MTARVSVSILRTALQHGQVTSKLGTFFAIYANHTANGRSRRKSARKRAKSALGSGLRYPVIPRKYLQDRVVNALTAIGVLTFEYMDMFLQEHCGRLW
jgi:hypothetical protein